MTRAKMRRLPKSFYAHDALVVARELLNKVLRVGKCSVRIVETEAYRGSDDPASHSYRGETLRNAVMFGPPGYLYVYFTYGMHYCANVVCFEDGIAQAVLLRAGEPIDGLALMRKRRGLRIANDRNLCNGPAKLAQALGIVRAHNGISLLSGKVGIYDDGIAPPKRPSRSARVGIREATDKQWRFYVPNNPYVSKPPRSPG